MAILTPPTKKTFQAAERRFNVALFFLCIALVCIVATRFFGSHIPQNGFALILATRDLCFAIAVIPLLAAYWKLRKGVTREGE